MNAPMLRSLGQDALYQVLDNKVFRILVLLVLAPVLATFLIGFREDEIVLLFGLKRWDYGPLLDFFSAIVGTRYGQDDPQGLLITGFSSLVIEGLAGSFGVIFTIAATAFFVPRMIEKGAADVLFHKPIGRLAFYLSRYFAGLVFIALFSALLVGGMYLGFLLVSGHHDPGILWAAITLTYLFGLIHGVSMLVGVMTRSTVAAILLTIVFFFSNGCIHQIWIEKEKHVVSSAVRELAEVEEAEDEEGQEEKGSRGPGRFARILIFALDTLHYVGPKTTDAGFLTGRLRAAVEGEDAYLDRASGLTVLELKGGLLEVPADAPAPVRGAEELLGPVVFRAETEGGRSFTIWTRPRREIEREKRSRGYQEDGSDVATELEARLAAASVAGVSEDRATLGDDGPSGAVGPIFLSLRAASLTWADAGRHHRLLLVGFREHFHTLAVETEADLSDEERAAWTAEVLGEAGILNETGSADWYGSRLGWDAELKFNLFFSLGSSLAFAVLVLLLGWWRLARIDF
jgi:ABC-type transport system involved in multi-copper enzyme maturation permease subunit